MKIVFYRLRATKRAGFYFSRVILGDHPVFIIAGNFGLHHVSSLFFYAVLGVVAAFVSLAFTESLLELRRALSAVLGWAQPSIGGINGADYDTLSGALFGSLTF